MMFRKSTIVLFVNIFSQSSNCANFRSKNLTSGCLASANNINSIKKCNKGIKMINCSNEFTRVHHLILSVGYFIRVKVYK